MVWGERPECKQGAGGPNNEGDAPPLRALGRHVEDGSVGKGGQHRAATTSQPEQSVRPAHLVVVHPVSHDLFVCGCKVLKRAGVGRVRERLG